MEPAGSQEAKASPSGHLYVYSSKPPDEARIFGLRGADIQDIRAPTEEDAPVAPDDWGFTDANGDGICKYCQLMLHPTAPSIIYHQQSLAKLISSTCRVCAWVEVSIVKGAPRLVEGFQRNDPAVCDPDSTSSRITISLSKEDKYTRAVAAVGDRGFFSEKGVPLNITTTDKLGELSSRVFWQPFEKRRERPPHARLEILSTWLGDCLNHHETCASIQEVPGTAHLPKRVLDLRGSPDVPSDTDDIKIRLRETDDGEVGRYIALSYCWGTDTQYHFKTTQGNLDEHKQGINFDTLPLTQREAILASLFLGIRYLWIDAMCIIQDSAADWEVEAAGMRSVYSNAVLTLAATFSHGPKDGLLNPLQGACCVSIHDESVMIRMETHRDIDASSEPLNTRAWTLQEAVLSPRMVSFGSEQWLWKCPSRYATEDGLLDGPQSVKEGSPQWASILAASADDDGAYLKHWYQLVSNYSRRELTYQSDKLKAIAGLADIFAKQTGYQYVTGLWVEDIARGLMWQSTSRGVRRVRGPVPSWSWASVDGVVLIQDFSGSHSSLSLLKVEEEWEGEALTSPLKSARLTVSAPSIQVSLGTQSLTQKLRYRLVNPDRPEEILGEAFLDSLEPVERGLTEIWCLEVFLVTSSTDESERFVLLLVPSRHEDNCSGASKYSRIGIGVIWTKSRFNGSEEGCDIFQGAATTDMILV